MPGIARPLLAEAGAAVGAVCVALHMATSLAPGHGDLVARGVLLAMAAGCLPCVRGLWLGPTPRVWAMTGAMYAVMVLAHLVLLSPSAAASGLHHGASGPTWTDVGMWGGLALAVVQLALVAVVLIVSATSAARTAGSAAALTSDAVPPRA
ncbi:MAG: hypothetical protein ACJ71Y_16380 [Blastococcus sp.]